jgi:hypothetical protein
MLFLMILGNSQPAWLGARSHCDGSHGIPIQTTF